MSGPTGGSARPAPHAPLPVSPHAALRGRLLVLAQRLEGEGRAAAGGELRAAVEEWWKAQQDWTERLAEELRLHHDINNALVGVRGNVQLLQLGPAAAVPGMRERLEVVIRESDRIREAAARLHQLKSALLALARHGEAGPASHAA